MPDIMEGVGPEVLEPPIIGAMAALMYVHWAYPSSTYEERAHLLLPIRESAV
jgi:hypothetical protein